jgi:excisionase family DNA binding protein
MANYLSLQEAADKLGIPVDRLVELRSQGQVRGFRDGASWKFPESEIDRLADDLADSLSGGSGLLVSDNDLGSGSSIMKAGSSGSVIGGDMPLDEGGSDLGIGSESLAPGSGGSDVNLIASQGEGSDVAIVASDMDLLAESSGGDLLEIDSAELQLEDSPFLHDSAQLDLAIEPNAGSTGPVTDEELKAISESHPDVLSPEVHGSGSSILAANSDVLGSDILGRSGSGSGSMLDLGGELDDMKLKTGSDLSFSGLGPDDDSGEELIGSDEDSGMDVLGSDKAAGSKLSKAGASSLELMGLDEMNGSDLASLGSRSADVLSELDLLSAEQQGSGLITGDSENLLVSSGLGSSIGASGFKDSDLSGLDDALADDDDLVIADDDDDLVISNAGNDISVAGDSGINLMSPSDSGLSLESEPLDLAGSSISALDLGAELSEGGSSGSGGSGGSGSMVDFQADEEFQLSPSGVGLDADIDSGSQVIEVEDSEAIGEAVEFDAFGADAGFAEPDVFGAEPATAGGDAFGDYEQQGQAVAIDDSISPAVASAPSFGTYEVPFSLFQCVVLMLILMMMSLAGMLMTDLVRNMWSYSEQSAPVSSLTDSLVSLMGWGP